jgi:hypothetical protein
MRDMGVGVLSAGGHQEIEPTNLAAGLCGKIELAEPIEVVRAELVNTDRHDESGLGSQLDSLN